MHADDIWLFVAFKLSYFYLFDRSYRVERMDMSHSSKSAWNLMRKLNGDSNQPPHAKKLVSTAPQQPRKSTVSHLSSRKSSTKSQVHSKMES